FHRVGITVYLAQKASNPARTLSNKKILRKSPLLVCAAGRRHATVAMAAPVSASLLPLARSAPSFTGPHYKNKRRIPMVRVCCAADDDEEVNDLGVKVALSMLKFYKREISPLLPSSCRYVPTCSEYSMQAYKRYGVAKGTILTAWRLCRCNPLGGQGYDPPRWFGEGELPEE
uniref:Uncharacterized protein n=5 Tax=Aegilops tauschii subsp. strangulata TaxID=200361 RepID=A0A453HT95_AEGTS